jgi:hypothetical protein
MFARSTGGAERKDNVESSAMPVSAAAALRISGLSESYRPRRMTVIYAAFGADATLAKSAVTTGTIATTVVPLAPE